MSTEKEVAFPDLSDSYAYTYEVSMVIQIIAASKDIADAKLNQEGGYISKRDVKFIRSTLLHKDQPLTEDK